MAAEFGRSVDFGLQLSKRIYYGKDAAPAVLPEMTRSSSPEEYLPTAPMVYAAVRRPEIVENPDIRSYQPYVHGLCDPPALIPLHLHGVSVEVDCYLDTAFVTVTGAWRVHCILGSKRCDCRVAIPMGEQGSVLGVEVDVTGTSYHSQLITMEDTKSMGNSVKVEDGRFLKNRIYTFKVPEVEGGSTVKVKATWSQKLQYQEGQLCLTIPFTFPQYVNPVVKHVTKREKILLNVKSGTRNEVLCRITSHPLKELRREVGNLGFIYEAEVSKWSTVDFSFSYSVSTSGLFGGVLLQSPSLNDLDQREMFCFYVFPGTNQSLKVFRKEVIFVIDISRSMRGTPLENVKTALLASLSQLSPQDSFNIIAFNEDFQLFSSSMELATKGAILNATMWVSDNLIGNGGTNILPPLKQALKLLAETTDSIPLIFLITDGAVDDEREICSFVKSYVPLGGSTCPRICTFGIGSYCNHYFLQMLAQIGRGHYDAAYDTGSIVTKLQRLLATGSSIIIANITMDTLEPLYSLEFFPCNIPDVSSSSPLIISGRYNGSFPDSVEVGGTLADATNFKIDLKVQTMKDVPLERVFARRHIDALTAQAWLSESKDLEDKVAKMSLQTGVPSEYTRMILIQTDQGKKAPETNLIPTNLIPEVLTKFTQQKSIFLHGEKITFLGSLGLGFGERTATADNIPAGQEDLKPPEPATMLMKVASNYFGRVLNRVCCMCCLQACSHVNDRCAITLTQLCAALSCVECFNCCFEVCEFCSCLQ